MSYDLGVFFTSRPLSEDDAMERYSAYCSGDYSHFLEPSAQIDAFLKDLTDRYPQIDDVPEDDLDSCPWSIAFDVSEGHVVMAMVHSRSEEVAPFVVSLAETHGLVCVDPQDGRVLTAPAGLLVAESEPSPAELAAEARQSGAPLMALIDEILTPRGFRKQRRVWRKEDDHAISAVEAGLVDGIFDVAFCLWSKEEGEEAASRDVKPKGGKYHLCEHLDGEMLPPRPLFRWLRAIHFGIDYAEIAPSIYGDTEEQARVITSHYDPHQPLTMEWRLATLRDVLEGYVLPFLDRVDAGEHKALLAEREASEEREREAEWTEMLAEWKPVIDICRELAAAGSDDMAILEKSGSAIRETACEAIVLSIALGWTMAKVRERMEAAGRKWDWLVDDHIEICFEDYDDLVLLPDGRAELRT
jgi:hypothetical protein